MVLLPNIFMTQLCSVIIMLTDLIGLCASTADFDFDFDKFTSAHYDDNVLTPGIAATDAKVQRRTILSEHAHVM